MGDRALRIVVCTTGTLVALLGLGIIALGLFLFLYPSPIPLSAAEVWGGFICITYGLYLLCDAILTVRKRARELR